ncbi:MAG: hypothetical protein ACR2M7_04940 [Bdellovibrionales bacterium]
MSRYLFIYLFFLCSCDSLFLSEQKQSIKENLVDSSSSVKRFLSQEALSGVLSEEFYLMKAYMVSAASYLELFSHFRGFQLEDGVKILFQRKESDLIITVSIPNYPPQTLIEKRKYFLNNNEVDFTVAVKNGTKYGFRVRIWENFVNKHGILKKPTTVLSGENLFVDSFSKGMTFWSKGKGVQWGLQLSQSQLIEGARVSPKTL